MCNRFVQESDPQDYLERILTHQSQAFAAPAGPQFNIPPGTRPLTALRRADVPTLSCSQVGLVVVT